MNDEQEKVAQIQETGEAKATELKDEELSSLAGGARASRPAKGGPGLFEVEDYSFDIEQVLNR